MAGCPVRKDSPLNSISYAINFLQYMISKELACRSAPIGFICKWLEDRVDDDTIRKDLEYLQIRGEDMSLTTLPPSTIPTLFDQFSIIFMTRWSFRKSSNMGAVRIRSIIPSYPQQLCFFARLTHSNALSYSSISTYRQTALK